MNFVELKQHAQSKKLTLATCTDHANLTNDWKSRRKVRRRKDTVKENYESRFAICLACYAHASYL